MTVLVSNSSEPTLDDVIDSLFAKPMQIEFRKNSYGLYGYFMTKLQVYELNKLFYKYGYEVDPDCEIVPGGNLVIRKLSE